MSTALLLAVIIFAAVVLIFAVNSWRWYSMRRGFKRLTGSQWSPAHEQTVDTALGILDPTAEVSFTIGAAHMYGRRDPRMIAEHYLRAIDDIIQHDRRDIDQDFIVGRIRDHVEYHPERFAQPELAAIRTPVRRAYQVIATRKPSIVGKRKPAQTKVARVENLAPPIASDTQNVHDSHLTKEFSVQYHKLHAALPADQLADNRAFAAFIQWMHKTKLTKAQEETLGRLFMGDHSIYDQTNEQGAIKIRERDIISTVWRRIHSPENVANIGKLLDALAMRLELCFEDGRPVCTTGRSEQILSALATLDAAPEMGILRTTAIVKGEMYSVGAKIIESELNSLPKKLKDAFNASTAKKLPPDELKSVEAAVARMRARFAAEIGEKYRGELPNEDIEQVLTRMNTELTVD